MHPRALGGLRRPVPAHGHGAVHLPVAALTHVLLDEDGLDVLEGVPPPRVEEVRQDRARVAARVATKAQHEDHHRDHHAGEQHLARPNPVSPEASCLVTLGTLCGFHPRDVPPEGRVGVDVHPEVMYDQLYWVA